MSDLYEQVTGYQDIFKKLLSKIPGFKGYVERTNRRMADKILRSEVAERYEEQWQRISALQRDLIAQGEIGLIDDLEAASIKFRQFIDRVRTASYGYSSFFEAAKVNEEELAKMYQYDLTLLELVDEVKHGIDNVETSIGTDGLPASIRALTSIAQRCVDAFNRRGEVMRGGTEGEH
ncbi:MAG: hypothetical protein ABFD14_02805 [Anaerolineaceae bacterium]|jgi:hypothetical protein